MPPKRTQMSRTSISGSVLAPEIGRFEVVQDVSADDVRAALAEIVER